MSTALLERPQPLVLIVEDRADSLRRRLDLFESFGCAALGASSRDDAIRELQATPLVDLLVTDIHMGDERHPDDKSGIALARAVRQRWSDLPIAGYSAYFAEGDLSADERNAFDVSFPRGSQRGRELRRQVESCVELAQRHRLRRAEQLDGELQRLRAKHAVEVPPSEVVRRFEPAGNASMAIEVPLLRAGYRLEMVSAASERDVREAFAVWLVPNDAGWECEVYGHPEIYAFGPTEGVAVDHLVELMALYWRELTPQTDLAGSVRRLAGFLERTVG
jgi:CheY-like chemotaxis protein